MEDREEAHHESIDGESFGENRCDEGLEHDLRPFNSRAGNGRPGDSDAYSRANCGQEDAKSAAEASPKCGA